MITILFYAIFSGFFIGIIYSILIIIKNEYMQQGMYRILFDTITANINIYVVSVFAASLLISILIKLSFYFFRKKEFLNLEYYYLTILPFIITAIIIIKNGSLYKYSVLEAFILIFSQQKSPIDISLIISGFMFYMFFLLGSIALGLIFYFILKNIKLCHVRSKKTLKPCLVLLALIFVINLTEFSVKKFDKKNKQNVVVIVIDTLRADHLPFYGYHKKTASFLSELSEKSILFENAIAPSTWTAPSTASLFTGYYPFQHGVLTGMLAAMGLMKKDPSITLNSIPPEITTIAELCKNRGYTTFGISDNLNICKAAGFSQGFDRFICYTYRTAEVVNQTIKKWGVSILRSKPYFLYIQYMDPHQPYNRRYPWFQGDQTIPLISPYDSYDSLIQFPEKIKTSISAYDSEINYVDQKIKELFYLFEWQENTVLIITSDHGEAFGEHKQFGHGRTLYKEENSVPLLIYSPEIKKSRRVSDNVSLIDILPTLQQVTQDTHDSLGEGKSLLSYVSDAPPCSRSLYAHLVHRDAQNGIPHIYEHKAIIHDDWKLIIAPSMHGLFSFKKHASEKENKINDHGKVYNEMKNEMSYFIQNCDKFTGVKKELAISSKDIEHLKALGYVQ